MEVISVGPFQVNWLLWRRPRDAWQLTLLCKGTFQLMPAACRIAEPQQPLHIADCFHDDDPARSVQAPSDFVPTKQHADVVLVGSAFSPRAQPTRSTVVRLSVGKLDKSVEVFAERAWAADGSIQEGEPFVKRALRYERAAGGPDTWNPVGLPSGGRSIPDLVRPGVALRGPAQVVEPVGFGPIAASWPGRQVQLGKHAGWTDARLRAEPLPTDFNLAYFNCAPPEQQVPALVGGERLVLENLHAEHPRLTTALPKARPWAFLERGSGAPADVPMTCDTLWIDTDRALVTLTFRGVVPLSRPDEPSRVVVAVREGAERPSWAEVEKLARGRPAVFSPSALKLGGAAHAPRTGEGLASTVALASDAAPADPSPVWVARPEREVAPPPLVAPAPAIQSPWAADALNHPRPSDAPSAPKPRPRLDSSGDGRAPHRPAPCPLVELVWFARASMPRIRKEPSFRAIIDALHEAPLDPGLAALASEPAEIEDHREVFEILARGEAVDQDGVVAAFEGAVREDGKYVPPLLLVAGELRFPFDEAATLRAAATTASPFASGDEALRAVLELVKDFARAPEPMAAPAVVEALTGRVKDVFGQDKRGVPYGYLDAQVEQALLERRQYQKRSVFGARQLRALFVGGAGQAAPAYLPEAVAERLPMFQRFRARLIAEIHPAADQYEAHPAALKVLALARTVQRKR